MNNESILEGVRQFIRVGLIAALPVLIKQLSEGRIEIKEISLVFVIAILIGLEKALHEEGKSTGDMNPVSKVLEL